MSAACTNVCNVSLIYNQDYQYSLPQKVLEGFLSGKAFDHPVVYTPEESERLHDDINNLFRQILSAGPVKEKLAIVTAGAPGAGKTVKLREDLEANRTIAHKNIAYVCPDDVCLQGQAKTYLADIERSDKSKAARQEAYNKWRPGSNAATHLILGNLIREQYAFYFGTTSSGPATGSFFDFLKKQGYRIRLIHVSAPDDVRWGSIQKRDNTFVQTTEQDVREKGLLLPQRINDAFLKYADEIEFYYRGGVDQNAILAATWIRDQSSEASGKLHIFKRDQYEQIKAIHNKVAMALTRPDLLWEASVERASKTISVSQ